MTQAQIKEIFESIQGEGPVVGYKQLFIRFCGCNLKCNYCDTDFLADNATLDYLPEELYKEISSQYDLSKIHSISLTGGEPLLHVKFLKEFLPLIKNKIKLYLETNATLNEELSEIKEYIDIISADIKLKSSTLRNTFDLHREFFKAARGIYTFAKVVFDENITEDEIVQVANFGRDFNIELILQPKMIDDKMSVSSNFSEKIFDKFLAQYSNVRLIPQVHKFLNVR